MRAPAISMAILAAAAADAAAQKAITGPVTVVPFNGYGGAGLDPDPDSDQLDSDDWRVTGMNDGDTSFGGSFTDGDHAEGRSSGGVSEGGLWSFEVLPDDEAFGFQQTSEDLTPGNIFLRLRNDTGETIVQPAVGYEGWVRNDTDRSSVVEVAWSVDGGPFVTVGALQLVTPEAADGSADFEVTSLASQLAGVVVPPGGILTLRWSPDDNGGSGGYDEIAIDDVILSVIERGDDPPPPDAGDDDPDVDVPDAGQPDPDGEPGASGDDADDGYRSAGCAAGGGAGGGALLLLCVAIALARRARSRR